jgi:hypothetical protein
MFVITPKTSNVRRPLMNQVVHLCPYMHVLKSMKGEDVLDFK